MSPLISSADMAEFRAMAEGNMQDSCIISRLATGNGPWNEETGQYDPAEPTVIYEGKCRIQIASVMGDASSVSAGERASTTQGSVLQLPVLESGDVAVKDVAKIVDAIEDASLVGREFTVEGRHGKSQATARRLHIVEVTG